MIKENDAAARSRRRSSAITAELCIPLTRQEAKQFEQILKISGLSRKAVTRYLGSWATHALREFESSHTVHPAWCLHDCTRTYKSAHRVMQRMIDAVGPREHWQNELLSGRRWPDVGP